MTHLVLPVLAAVIAAVIIASFLSTKNVVFVNAPPNLFNEGYNPFLGTWQNGDAVFYGFTQVVIEKDENNLVWAELFTVCIDHNCSLGKVRAELNGQTLSAHHVTDDRSLSMVMSFPAGTTMMMDLSYSQKTPEGGKNSGQATLGFNKV